MTQTKLVLRTTSGDRDVAVDFDDEATVGQLADRIAVHVAATDAGTQTLERVSRHRATLPRDGRLARQSLRSGDVIRLVADDGEREAAIMAARLRVETPDLPPRVIEIAHGDTVIGRAPGCDLQVDDRLASRRHAKLVATDGLEIVDLGATNVTLVNGSPATAPRRLRRDDRIRIGDTLIIVEHAPAAAAGGPTGGNQVEFHRPPRTAFPYEGVDLRVPAPPPLPQRTRLPMATAIAPILLGVVLLLVTDSPVAYLFLALGPLLVLGSLLERRLSGRADFDARVQRHREAVREVLGRIDEEREREVRQRLAQAPAVATLGDHVRELSPRVWERRPGDSDFLALRIGLAPEPSRSTLELEPGGAAFLRAEIEDLPAQYVDLPPVPTTVSLDHDGSVAITGDDRHAGDLARTMLAQTVVLHSPADVVVCAMVSADHEEDWSWLGWLPHTDVQLSPLSTGHLACSPDDVATLLSDLGRLVSARHEAVADARGGSPDPRVVLVVDDRAPVDIVRVESLVTTGPAVNVHVVWVSGSGRLPPEGCPTVVEVAADGQVATIHHRDGRPRLEGCQVERLDASDARALALDLSPLVDASSQRSRDAGIPSSIALVDLLDGARLLDDPGEVLARWRESRPGGGLRGIVGAGRSGPFSVDLTEHGPHAMVAGSGEATAAPFVVGLLASLAATHSPSRVTFLLADIADGRTFAQVTQLPHTVGVATGLTPATGRRVVASLEAELARRTAQLTEAGASDLPALAAQDPAAPPHLVVVVANTNQLRRDLPEVLDGIVAAAGRAHRVGIHLVLASDDVTTGGPPPLPAGTNLTVSLRLGSEDASLQLLGTPAAAQIDRATPGRAVALVGGGEEVAVEDEEEQTLLDLVVDQLAPHGRPAHQVWLPPLDESPTLDQLLGPLAVSEQRGFGVTATDQVARLRTPLAIVDRPYEQRRDELVVDLAGAAGHVAVVGQAQSGKSTAVRSLITSFALTHSPDELQFYVVDLAGGTLRSMDALPHVGGVATNLEPDLVRRTVAEMTALLTAREEFFTEHAIDSIAAYRTGRANGTVPADRFATDVVLVVDGWMTMRQEFEVLEDTLSRLASRGLGFGIHVLGTASKWADFRISMRDVFQSRIELKLGEAFDSEVDRKLAATVPASQPGRGLSPDGKHMLVALPRVDGVASDQDLGQVIRDLGARMTQAWPGQPAPPVRTLPDELAYQDLVANWTGRDDVIPMGIDEDELGPVGLDVAADGHLVAVGANQCGKSSLLRVIARGIVTRYTPDQARIVIIDYRRSLLGTIDTEHLIEYAASSTAAETTMRNVTDSMKQRLPGPDVTQEELRARSWWKGPELFVIVDDYELVAAPSGNPMAQLAEVLPQASDIGLHLIIARSMSGAGRSMFDPVIQRLRESGSPGLVMSGTRDEGTLFGDVRPKPLPPGRGTLVTRTPPHQLIQTAFLDAD